MKSNLKAIDFFCGTGGMTYGMSLAGIKVLAGIDIEAECRKSYEWNNPGSKFIEADIHSYPVNKLEKDLKIKRNDNELVFIGCSPCQFWSKIYTDRSKSENSKNLLKEFQNFVEYYRPGFIVIENVPGLYSKRNLNALAGFLNFLDKEKYVYDNKIIEATDYGVPQTRKRYLLIATRVAKTIQLPEPLKDKSQLTVRNFIGDKKKFASIKAGECDSNDSMHFASSLSDLNLQRISITPKDGGDRSAWSNNEELQLKAYKNKDHIFTDVYGRMYWDKPSPTITTKFYSLSNGRFGHPEENRALSLREGATLQTFPRKYRFFGSSQSSISKQIGNAVPPEMAKKVGKSILEAYSKVNVRSN